MDDPDIGDVAEVPEDQRLDVDEQALDDTGVDFTTGEDDDLDDVYADPGEVVVLDDLL